MGAGLDRSPGAVECCGRLLRLLAFVFFLVCACLLMAMVATDSGAGASLGSSSSSSSSNAATSAAAMTMGGSPAWRSGGHGGTADADAFRSSERRIPKGPTLFTTGVPGRRRSRRAIETSRRPGTATKATTGRFHRRSSSCSSDRLDGKDELPDMQFVSRAEDEICAKTPHRGFW